MASDPLPLLTIGHSNLDCERFMALLKGADVTAVVDVRSVPFSRRFPWFSGKTLAERLKQVGVSYLPMGDTLGGRPSDPALYCEGIADYKMMAETPKFHAGLDRVADEARRRRVCLMCAEREPLDCHRCLLVARALSQRGHALGHILVDGRIEPHAATEDRLLAAAGETDLFFQDRKAALADAYRARVRAVAARLRVRSHTA